MWEKSNLIWIKIISILYCWDSIFNGSKGRFRRKKDLAKSMASSIKLHFSKKKIFKSNFCLFSCPSVMPRFWWQMLSVKWIESVDWSSYVHCPHQIFTKWRVAHSKWNGLDVMIEATLIETAIKRNCDWERYRKDRRGVHRKE